MDIEHINWVEFAKQMAAAARAKVAEDQKQFGRPSVSSHSGTRKNVFSKQS